MLDSDDHGQTATRPIPSALSAMLRVSDGILDLLPIATFICDANGTILQYNRHAAAVWGRTPKPGQTHEQFTEHLRFFEMDGTPAARALVTEVLGTGSPVRDVERIVERPDGTRLVVSVNVDPLHNAKGELVGAVNCFLDITERKRVDAALETSRFHAFDDGLVERLPERPHRQSVIEFDLSGGEADQNLLALRRIKPVKRLPVSIPAMRIGRLNAGPIELGRCQW